MPLLIVISWVKLTVTQLHLIEWKSTSMSIPLEKIVAVHLENLIRKELGRYSNAESGTRIQSAEQSAEQ